MSLPQKARLSISTFIVLGVVYINLMPDSIQGDLERIGNGQQSLVFVYDLNLAASNLEALEINEAQSVSGDTANLLIVRAGDLKSCRF